MNYPKDIKGQIYKITCITTNKVYIGQTKNYTWNHEKYRPHGFIKRFNDHISEALNNTKAKQCFNLNNAIRKYGKENFIVELIHECSIKFLDYFERLFIAEYNSRKDGYNLTDGGFGAKMTDDIKNKLSERTKTYFQNSENREKYSKIHWQKNDIRKIEALEELNITSVQISKLNGPIDKIKCLFFNEDGQISLFNLGGKHVDHETAFMRALFICHKILPSESIIIHDELTQLRNFINMEDIEKIYEIPKFHYKSESNRERSQKYEELNDSQRIDRFKKKEIQKISISMTKVKKHEVFAVKIQFTDSSGSCTFGGKHKELAYYHKKCGDFLEKLKDQNKFDLNQTKLIGRINDYIEENCSDDDALFKIYNKWM